MTQEFYWSTPERISGLSRAPFTRELAAQVAARLKQGHSLCNCHRDYCGHGLTFHNGRFLLLEVCDGVPEPETNDVIADWDEEGFIDFLASQSDYSCSGADPDTPLFYTARRWGQNNQRITQRRLEEFVSR